MIFTYFYPIIPRFPRFSIFSMDSLAFGRSRCRARTFLTWLVWMAPWGFAKWFMVYQRTRKRSIPNRLRGLSSQSFLSCSMDNQVTPKTSDGFSVGFIERNCVCTILTNSMIVSVNRNWINFVENTFGNATGTTYKHRISNWKLSGLGRLKIWDNIFICTYMVTNIYAHIILYQNINIYIYIYALWFGYDHIPKSKSQEHLLHFVTMSKTPKPSCTDRILVTYHANLRGIAWDAKACVNKNTPCQHTRVNTLFWNRTPQGTPQATAKKVDIEE